MNLIKLIPYNLRERIRKIVFGKNHFHDLVEYLATTNAANVFDVGAQHGYESIVFSKAGMRVWAFEPNVTAMGRLVDNIQAERVAERVRWFIVSMSDRTTWISQTASIHSVGRINTLTNFCETFCKYPDFLKIDTDGDDIRVLNGYPFDKHRPMILSVEYDATGAVDRKLLSEGYNLIYAIYKPQTRTRRAIFSRYSLSPEFYGGEWGDVIAVLPERYVALRDKLFGF